MSWKVAWLPAQIAGLVFSSLVWIVVAGLSLTTAATILLAGVVGVLGRNTRAGLWWRLGARPATPSERDLVQPVIVQIASLRGRHQPRIWVGTRTGNSDALMPTAHDLVVSRALLERVATGQLPGEQVCVLVCRALGWQPVMSSALVASADVYCIPWRIVTIFSSTINGAMKGTPLVALAWKARWIVFGMAMIDSALAGRWPALICVAVLTLLSAAAPGLRNRWVVALGELGDRRVLAEGFGRVLAPMVQSHGRSRADVERVAALSREPFSPAVDPSMSATGRVG